MTTKGRPDDVIARLAAYAASVDSAQLNQHVRDEVARRLIDAIACAYGALASAPVVALRAVAEERAIAHGCTVWGSAERSSPELAAFVNGTAVRLLDYSDYTAGGHPSDNIAAVIAACEWADATVDTLVAGIVVNYEVWGELGRLYLRYRGWDQGTTASIAATCAIGRVLGLSTEQLASALGMVATSTVSLFNTRRGELSAWKGLAVPYAAQSSVLVSCLAAKGITGPLDAFAGEFGFWQQISGEFHVERLYPGAEPTTIFATGYKHWPVEFEAQFAVWLAQRIRAQVAPERIEHVMLYTSEWTRDTIANDPTKWAPTTRETADHSLPYIVAVSLCRGRIDYDDFAPEMLETPEYVAMMGRISVHADETITAASHDRCALRAKIRTVDGDELPFEISEGRATPMSDAQLDEKWSLLTARSHLTSGSDALLADLRKLEGAQPVRALITPLAARK